MDLPRARRRASGRADAIDARAVAGDDLPLAGVPVAVKDNIDVAGIPTTAGCAEFAYTPDLSAPVVQRMVDAGALIVGKTNLDQFATGLVGTRSPATASAATRSTRRSSPAARARARRSRSRPGRSPFALGTDTAGSGRVPRAAAASSGSSPHAASSASAASSLRRAPSTASRCSLRRVALRRKHSVS